MNDRELLELAAKAAGYKLDGLASRYIAQGVGPEDMLLINDTGGHSVWNPRDYDADAFRLASKLMMTVEFGNNFVQSPVENYGDGTDPLKAVREAIFRTAIAIGLSL